MVDLQKRGCHNINFVTPSHVIQPIIEALPIAVDKGLEVPLVYNCGGYERVSALKLLERNCRYLYAGFQILELGSGDRALQCA